MAEAMTAESLARNWFLVNNLPADKIYVDSLAAAIIGFVEPMKVRLQKVDAERVKYMNNAIEALEKSLERKARVEELEKERDHLHTCVDAWKEEVIKATRCSCGRELTVGWCTVCQDDEG